MAPPARRALEKDPEPGLAIWLRRGLAFSLGALVVAATAIVFVLGARVVALVLLAILFASGLRPVVDGVRTRAPFGRTASAGLIFASFGAFVIIVGAIVIPTALSQLDELGRTLPDTIAGARQAAADIRPPAVGSALVSLLDQVARATKGGPAPTADAVVAAGSTAVEIVASIATVLTLVFFWLHERPRMQRFALAFVPLERRAGIREAWNDVDERLGSWVRGQLSLMGLMFVATSTAYFFLGLPSALVLGLIAGLMEAVPIVGPLLGAVPALIVAATIRPELVLAVAVVYVAIQLLESNVVVPVVMRSTVGLSPFLVLVSLLIGATLGGIIGAFLAVPFAASVEIILERLQSRDVPVGLEPDVDGTTEASAEFAVAEAPVSG